MKKIINKIISASGVIAFVLAIGKMGNYEVYNNWNSFVWALVLMGYVGILAFYVTKER